MCKESNFQVLESLENKDRLSSFVLFDHKEVGSNFAQRVGGHAMHDTMSKVNRCLLERY